MPRFIDSHAHIDFPAFDADRAVLLQHCVELDVETIIVPGVERKYWPRLLHTTQHFSNAETAPKLLPALGIHPLFLNTDQQSGQELNFQSNLQFNQQADLQELDSLLEKYPEIIAVGEVGLDFFRLKNDEAGQTQKLRQTALFTAQIELAEKHQKPLLLHLRNSHETALPILKQQAHHGGIAHAFSGSWEQAKRYIDLGFLIGIGGVVTRPNAKKLRTLTQKLPLDVLALETDAPDLPPVWLNGERNSPEQIPKIAAEIAALRGESVDIISEMTTQNVKRMLNLLN